MAMASLTHFAMPWKKKRGKDGKSILLPNIGTSGFRHLSTTSLPLPPDYTNTQKDIKSPPPCYDDDMSLYASTIAPTSLEMPGDDHTSMKHQRHIAVEQREEEGKEDLPPYECTVYKMGYMMVKNEMDGPDSKSTRRSWRKLYIMLWGTNLRAYKTVPMTELEEKKPVWCYSMQDAEAGQPSDYRKYQHVIRLKFHHGAQLLIRTKNEKDQIEWIEHLQASVNVSLDLDERKMPQFITSRRRRRGRVQPDDNRSRQREGALI